MKHISSSLLSRLIQPLGFEPCSLFSQITGRLGLRTEFYLAAFLAGILGALSPHAVIAQVRDGDRFSTSSPSASDDRIALNLGSHLSPRLRSDGRRGSHHLDPAALQLDTPETAILSGRRENRFISFYRGLIYSRYFQDSNRADSFADLESQALAEDLLTYQTSRTLRWLVDNSAIARIYDNFVATYSRYTTASIEQQVDGSLSVADSSSKKRKLLQLKLHASSRNGVEPRLVIDDLLTLRYDLLHQQALLEYQINF